MIVTIDTNVIYQALRSSAGASYRILRLIREGMIRVTLSHQVLLEYEAVLTRESSLKAFNLSTFRAHYRCTSFISKFYARIVKKISQKMHG